MADNFALDEQSPSRQQAGGQEDWKARFDGAIRKIEQITLENRRLNEELAGLTSQREQLSSQLAVKDAEKSAAVNERDKRLQEIVQAKGSLEGQLAELQSLKTKVDVVKKMGRPDLVEIFDSIPNMTDPTALENVLGTFANFADKKVRAREQELMAGITPGVGSAHSSSSVPTTPGDWMKYIEAKPLGSQDRAKAMDDYWQFQMNQGA